MRAPLLAIVLCGSACLSPPGQGGDDDGDGPGEGLRTKLITLHPPPLVDTLGAVPVAIILDRDDDLAAAARPDGLDIRAGDGPRGSQLFHEIEEWDPDTGALVLWVVVPILIDGTVVELRYGDGGDYPSSPVSVWLSYAGVWHLAGDPKGLPPQMADSTGANHGVVSGDAPAPVRGVAGPALAFDGTGEIDLGAGGGRLDFDTTSFSYQAWVEVADGAELGLYDQPWFKGGSSATYRGYDLELGTGEWIAGLNDGTVGWGAELSAEPVTGSWVQLVAVVDRNAGLLRTYLDGAEVGTSSIDGMGSLSNEFDASIGGSSFNETYFAGKVDEVRVGAGVLSPAAIAVEYANLRSPATFLEIGPEEVE